jgi:hypothetical protein
VRSGLRARRSVAQSVQRDVEDVIDLSGCAGWDLRDPSDHLYELGEVSVGAHSAGILSALEQRLAGLVERGAAGLKHHGVALDVFQELLRQRLLVVGGYHLAFAIGAVCIAVGIVTARAVLRTPKTSAAIQLATDPETEFEPQLQRQAA